MDDPQIEFDAQLHRQIQLWIAGGEVELPSNPTIAAVATKELQKSGSRQKRRSLSNVTAALSPKALLDRMLPQLTAKS